MSQKGSSENFLDGYNVYPVSDVPQLIVLELNWHKTKRDYRERRVAIGNGEFSLTLTRGQAQGLSDLLSAYTYDPE